MSRLTTALMALVFAAALVPLAAGATHEPVTRVEADGPVAAAVALSQLAVDDDGAPDVLLGRADLFADLLASGGAQGAADTPLLLTERDGVSPAVRGELRRVGAQTVHLLGGTAALPEAIADELRAEGYAVERVEGPTRIETAIAVAGRFTPQATAAVVVRAHAPAGGDPTRAFADALAAGGLAAADGVPVLLTESNDLSAATRDYLAASAVEAVTVVGGADAVSDAVLDDLRGLGLEVERLAGPNRAATAAAVAQARAADAEEVVLAEGTAADAYASAFPAALLSAQRQAPVLLSAGDGLPPETTDALAASAGIERLVCAPLVVATACDQAAELLGLDQPHGIEPSEPFPSSDIALVGPDGERVGMPVYVAHTPQLRGRGLMHRESLPREAGMIFLFPDDHEGGFFMKDTLIPLTIAFVTSDGVVREILDMEPCEEEPCEVYDPGIAYRYAVEVNQGYDDEIGLVEGWTVDLPDDLPPAS